MKMLSMSVISILVLATCTSAQPPDTLWTQTWGGGAFDCGYSVQQTSDGGYIIAGSTGSYAAAYSSVWLIKTDASGTEQWSQIFGGSGGDNGSSVQQTSDGGYIIAGDTESYGAGGHDVWLIRTDAGGDTLWTQTFGGSDEDFGYSVQQTSDGGYIIAGYTRSYGAGGADVYLIKTDASGIEQWSQTYGGVLFDEGRSVQQTSDGGYIIAGYTRSYGAGGPDVWLIKTNASGVAQWSQPFGGGGQDGSNSVQQTSDGGYIIAGWLQSGDQDVWLIKTDAGGDALWTQTFGGSGGDFGTSVQQTSDGGYVIAGWTASYGTGGDDVYVIRTDASGVAQWSQTYGGSNRDRGYSVQQTSDGGYIITGYRERDPGGYGNVWLIRLGYATGVLPSDQPEPVIYSLLPAYPNPFNPSTLIRFQIPTAGDVQIKVYDIQGRVVATLTDGWQTPGSYQVPFNADNLCSGIYLARLTVGDFTQTQKLVLMK